MNLSPTTPRRSPVHHLLEPLTPQWGEIAGSPLALRVGPAGEEAAALATLALGDLSALPKVGFKGAGAAAWLASQGVAVPAETYDTRALAGGGRIARLGAGDFLLEGGVGGLPTLEDTPAQVHRVERQDATFLLVGARAPGVLAQMCSIDFASASSGRLLLTRAAGINCGVVPDEVGGVPRFRFWVDFTWAVSLWETLAEIATELGGRVVGATCLEPW